LQLEKQWGLCPQTPEVYPPGISGEAGKKNSGSRRCFPPFYPAACAGLLLSIALFDCKISIGDIFGY